MTDDLDAIMEDAALMRQLKAEIKGLPVILDVGRHTAGGAMCRYGGDICGDGKAQALDFIWRRIMLEASQGV